MNDIWQIEENIPDSDKLYFRIHNDCIFDTKDLKNIIRSRAFYNTPATGNNMSTDWEKYSTPQQTLDFVSKQFKTGTATFKDKTKFSVVSFLVFQVKNIDTHHHLLHDPVQRIPEILGNPNNRAHCLVDGKISDDKEDAVEIRAKFIEIAQWEILQRWH